MSTDLRVSAGHHRFIPLRLTELLRVALSSDLCREQRLLVVRPARGTEKAEQRAGHHRRCQRHDDHHGEDAWRQDAQVVADVQRDQLHQAGVFRAEVLQDDPGSSAA